MSMGAIPCPVLHNWLSRTLSRVTHGLGEEDALVGALTKSGTPTLRETDQV